MWHGHLERAATQTSNRSRAYREDYILSNAGRQALPSLNRRLKETITSYYLLLPPRTQNPRPNTAKYCFSIMQLMKFLMRYLLHIQEVIAPPTTGFIHPGACCSTTNTCFRKSNRELLSMKVVYFIQNT